MVEKWYVRLAVAIGCPKARVTNVAAPTAPHV